MMMRSTPGMSRPRAATSVAISSEAAPERNLVRVRVRVRPAEPADGHLALGLRVVAAQRGAR